MKNPMSAATGAAPVSVPEGAAVATPADKAAAFLRVAEDAAREIVPESPALALSRGGLVALSIRAVVPVNVAAALEGDALPAFLQDALGASVRCGIEDGVSREECERLRLPADGVGIDGWASVPSVAVAFEVPTDGERREAADALARALTRRNGR